MDEAGDVAVLLESVRAGSDAAAESFCRQFYPIAEKAVSSAGVAGHSVREVANKALLQVLEKCRAGVAQTSVEGFLWNHARKRALDWLRAQQRKTKRESSLDDTPVPPARAIVEPALRLTRSDMARHRRAIKHAQKIAAEREPVGMICLRLHQLHEVDYKLLSRMWGHGPESWAFRRAQRAGRLIREELLRWHLEHGEIGTEAELFEDLAAACRESPRVLRAEVRSRPREKSADNDAKRRADKRLGE